MAVPLLHREKSEMTMSSNSLDLEKLRKNQRINHYPCLKSIWAVLFSIFIYFSIFYVFNLSPSSVVSTTGFWFFISNTLVVIIISTDLSAFLKTATSTGQDGLYDEYAKNDVGHARAIPGAPAPPSVPTSRRIMTIPAVPEEEEVHEKVIDMDGGGDNNQRALEIYTPRIPTAAPPDLRDDRPAADQITEPPEKRRKKHEGIKCARSYSDKAALMAAVEENEERMVLQRTLSERHETPPATPPEENELSNISNEELNRRVEEFIRRFNRQIRLQAATTRHSSASEIH
ncbi:uncharacterized protein LOC127247924 [Andrographis paniculata]|uniref:uncharacterized protein LOC127247924 n=1 Tax=Andrographis paniculata TaxID=175694 RepID=UPI0021E728EF|nr:uncharacterized protein LOC127247924 [Andrographis paniculata]